MADLLGNYPLKKEKQKNPEVGLFHTNQPLKGFHSISQ